MDNKFVKLGDLIGSKITVVSVEKPKWRMWDAGAKKFQWSNEPENGMRKAYFLKTDKGILTVSTHQLASIMDESKGILPENDTVLVGSNGKTGIDIRYTFKRVEEKAQEPKSEEQPFDEDIPF